MSGAEITILVGALGTGVGLLYGAYKRLTADYMTVDEHERLIEQERKQHDRELVRERAGREAAERRERVYMDRLLEMTGVLREARPVVERSARILAHAAETAREEIEP